MTEQKNPSKQPSNPPAAHQSEAESAEQRAGVPENSSHDATSRTKAGKDEGAGGGAKQQQKH